MATEVMLLSFWPSPFGMRVKIALAEKGVEYEYRDEDLTKKSELLLKMNPIHKQIPVLVHKNRPIVESVIIQEYIDEVWNDKTPLLPSDPYLRAQSRFWADFGEKKIYINGKTVWSTKGEEQEAAKKQLTESLKILEQQLGDKPYLSGDAFGFIDLNLIPFYIWFHTYETAGKFKIDFCPKLIEWGQRCLLRESVANSVPDPKDVCAFITQVRIKRGLE